jgi:hypothetical protein
MRYGDFGCDIVVFITILICVMLNAIVLILDWVGRVHHLQIVLLMDFEVRILWSCFISLVFADPSDPQSTHENCWRRAFTPYVFPQCTNTLGFIYQYRSGHSFQRKYLRYMIWGPSGPGGLFLQTISIHMVSFFQSIDLLIQKLIMYWLLLACWYVFLGPYNGGPSKRYFSTFGLTWFGLPLVFGNQVFEDVVAWWSRRKARWCPSEVGLSLDEVLGWWMLMVFFFEGEHVQHKCRCWW